MARPLKPFIRGGGYYPSNKWTPLVYNGGYTTMDGGEEPEPPTPVYWKTVTGVSPLALLKAMAKPLKSLTQFGKCTQASTPTPDAPVDILCNNGRVVAGNCISNIPDGQGTFINPSDSNTTRIYKAFPTGLIAGRGYTVTVTGANWSIIVQRKKPDGTDWSNVSAWVTTYEFVPDAGYVYGIAIRIGGGTANITPADFNGTLTLDTTDGKPWADGTPETLTVRGVNLFDKNTMDTGQGYYVNNSGNIVNGYNANRTVWIPCKPNTKYSYWHTEGAGGCRAFAMNKDTIDTSDSSEWLKGSPASLGKNVVSTVTTPADAVKLYITAARSNLDPERSFDEQLADFMVVEGEVAEATAYEPYVTPQAVNDIPMLLSVGDYKDEVEIISGSPWKHRIGIKVFDGTENISKAGNCFQYTVSGKVTGKAGLFCTHFQYSTATSSAVADFCVMEYNSATIGFRYDACADAASFKSFLAAQYAAGTPVIVLYPLAEETTEQTTAHALNTTAGTNVVSWTAAVDGKVCEVVYKGIQSPVDPDTSNLVGTGKVGKMIL